MSPSSRMAITALALPEMVILRQVMKPRLLVTFAGIAAGVVVVVVGYLFNPGRVTARFIEEVHP